MTKSENRVTAPCSHMNPGNSKAGRPNAATIRLTPINAATPKAKTARKVGRPMTSEISFTTRC